jgi:hypothetical protein
MTPKHPPGPPTLTRSLSRIEQDCPPKAAGPSKAKYNRQIATGGFGQLDWHGTCQNRQRYPTEQSVVNHHQL